MADEQTPETQSDMTADQILEQAMEQVEGTDQEAEEKAEEAPQKIRIGDAELELAEALDLLEKGRDYTKKTQALAEERKQIEPIRDVYEAFALLPTDKQMKVVDIIKNNVGGGNDTPTETPALASKLSEAGYEDDIVQAFAIVESENKALRDQLSKILPEFQNFVREVRGDTEARAVSDEIKSKYGVAVPPEELRRVQKETGIENLKAAWLVANEEKLVGGGLKPSRQQAPKPRTPEGESKAFDVKNATADDILAAVERGLIELPKQT